MKKRVLLIVLLICLFMTGCGTKTKEPEVEKAEKKEVHEYDGVYKYIIRASKSNSKTSGYLIINGDRFKSSLGVLTRNDSSEEQKFTGKCNYDGSNIVISNVNFEYTCTRENKNLKCSSNRAGLTKEIENEILFEYKYSENEYDEIYKSYSLLLPENFRWEISAAEAKDIYQTSYIATYPDFNTKFSTVDLIAKNLDTSYGVSLDDVTMWFWEDKLIIYNINMLKKPQDPYDSYKKIRDFYISKYGNPSTEDYQWVNDTYKDDESKWNQAMIYNYLKISTTWDLGDSYLFIDWDYNNKIVVDYVKKGYENHR